MASNGPKAGGWSEEEKNQLFMKIIGQLTDAGGKINYGALNMPGRTPKAIQHVIQNAKKQAAEFAAGNANGEGGSAAAATPKKRGTAKRSRKAAKTEDEEEGGDEDEEKTPTKKRAKAGPQGKKAAKQPADNADEGDVKEEDDEDALVEDGGIIA